MLCCICLLESHKMLGIYDEKGKNLNIANIINKYFWFKVMLLLQYYMIQVKLLRGNF